MGALTTIQMRTDPRTRRLYAVADQLLARGIPATVEYPGALSVRLAPTVDVWTGLTGWDYGTVSRLDRDNCWQPDEDAVAEVDVPEDCTDPEQIAAAWAAFAAAWGEAPATV